VNDLKATGRPKQQIPILPRIGLTLALAVLLLEALVQAAIHHVQLGPLAQHMAPLVPLLQRYAYARRWVIEHPVAAACILGALVALALFIVRWCLLFWHNEIVARLSGTRFDDQSTEQFPLARVDILAEIARRPIDRSLASRGAYIPRSKFVGLSRGVASSARAGSRSTSAHASRRCTATSSVSLAA
jgi:hypothetical protein